MTASVTYLAAQALAALISATVPELAGKVTVVHESPTAEGGYPAAAVLPEPGFRFDAEHDVEVVGVDGLPVVVDDGRALMSAGALHASVRIWVAARTPAQRERLQGAILRRFFGDEFAPTRLTVTLAGLEVDGFTSPVSWPVAFFVDDGEWQDEKVFSERRWAYLKARVDIPILLLREESWRVTEMVAALAAGALVTSTATDLEEVLVDSDGQTTPAP